MYFCGRDERHCQVRPGKDGGKMKIIVTNYWCHPHYGGDRTVAYEFTMKEAEQAETKFNELCEKDDGYSHTTIHVVEVGKTEVRDV